MKIRVKVKTNTDEQSVEKVFGGGGFEELYFVKLKSSPEENKANRELVKVLSEHFGREVKIRSGFTSKKKIVEISE